MNRFLNNTLKGLLAAFVIVALGGFLSLKIQIPSTKTMVLVSSSLANTIKTDTKKIEKDIKEVEEKDNLEENHLDEIQDTKTEIEEPIKEEPKKDESSKSETEEKSNEVEKKEETPSVKEVIKETPEAKVEQKSEEVVTNTKENTDVSNNTTENSNPTTNENTSISQAPSIPTPNGNYTPNLEAASTVSVSATYTGLVTAYGPDCYGCTSGRTATGYNVSNGNIYYNHPTYGNIRIVAGDKSILRRVVRISGLKNYSEPILAIVLDTGGDIGFNKPKGIILDLLFTSEKSKEVLNFGKQQAVVEVLN